METTFITIHDLSPEAKILYSSDSIIDLLGYAPEEVVNRSCWDFFHQDEISFARARHGAGVEMDKAAVLSYCLLKDKSGQWIGCEVVFTVVFDVMVGCTSIYRRGLRSKNRATDAPAVRRLFSASPRDPRYHMLSHLSSKFSLPPIIGAHEPRAALFLNRYTRTLTIMYATEGLTDVLGISGEELRGRSFYYCIEQNCLQDAVRCLENAKANDSIAYLRFWYRDPRQDEEVNGSRDGRHNDMNDSGDETMEDAIDESDGEMDVDHSENPPMSRQELRELSHDTIESQPLSSTDSVEPVGRESAAYSRLAPAEESRASSGRSSVPYTHEAVFGEPEQRNSSASSVSNSPSETHRALQRGSTPLRNRIELEAVVSCTSDGLVVCMRRARPLLANELRRTTKPMYANGLFAVPWATEPMMPPPQQRPVYAQRGDPAPGLPSPIMNYAQQPQPNIGDRDDFMSAIRDIAVFAWALTGINGSLAEYGRGQPRGEAQPASGLPIWQPEADQQQRLQTPLGASASRPSSGAVTPASANYTGTKQNFSRPARKVSANSSPMVNGEIPMIDGTDQMVDGTGEGVDGIENMVDGVDGDQNRYHRNLSSASSERGTPPNHAEARSYQLVPMVNGQGEMVDGVNGPNHEPQESKSYGANLRSKKLWSSESLMRDGFHSKEMRSNEGVGKTYNARKSPTDPYGFGDPGLGSRGVRIYNSTRSQDGMPNGVGLPDGQSSGKSR